MRTILIVGGGAAGLMAAISASSGNHRVILLERNEKAGKKLFITGKGRCNVTNAIPISDFYDHIPTNPRFLYSAFSRFSNTDMIDFLERNGVATKTERGQRVFPVSDKSSDVIRALVSTCQKNGVSMRYHTKVTRLLFSEDRSQVTGVETETGEKIRGDAVILACGGCSYSSTGSDGSGYELAKQAGHHISTPQPSLVPFVIEEPWCRDLMGLTLKNVEVTVKSGKKTIYKGFGEMLFTHFGVSGPLILTASTRLGKLGKSKDPLKLFLDLKPALSSEQLEKRILREFDTYRNKNISNVIERLLPKSMVPVFLSCAGIPAEKKVRDITRKERKHLEEKFKIFPMHIKGTRSFDEAIVTRGGVRVKEIDPSTMRSKLVENLYFAGEMIDVDAETGGFNLQIAWSTSYIAGQNT